MMMVDTIAVLMMILLMITASTYVNAIVGVVIVDVV
jgi:hypothetical protein